MYINLFATEELNRVLKNGKHGLDTSQRLSLFALPVNGKGVFMLTYDGEKQVDKNFFPNAVIHEHWSRDKDDNESCIGKTLDGAPHYILSGTVISTTYHHIDDDKPEEPSGLPLDK